MYSPVISELIDALRALPGVGPKSAQRMALQLLERNRKGAQRLAGALTNACEKIGHCESCRTLTEEAICLLIALRIKGEIKPRTKYRIKIKTIPQTRSILPKQI